MISEDQIKKAALRFLKAYYKFRPRLGETRTRTDMQASDGIIADGYLTFPQEDGHNFLATIEATSRATRDEVHYNLQQTVLMWDSIAVSGLITALAFCYGYVYDHFTIRQIGQLGTISVLLGIFALSFVLYFFLSRSLRRYRYIYAIEQFKKYHADEQWVAIGEDVFANENDFFYRELKDQCVYNGFGLITVSQDENPQMLITPSRQELFKRKRQLHDFLSQSSGSRAVQIASGIKKRYDNWMTRLFVKQNDNRKNLLRYQKTYHNQIILSAIALGLISAIYFEELKDTAVEYVDEEGYVEQMETLKKTAKGEASVKPPDRLISELDEEYDSLKGAYDLQEDVDLLSPTDGPPGAVDQEDLYAAAEEPSTSQQLAAILDGEYVVYDCERFFNFDQNIFIVQEGLYNDLSLAKRRMGTYARRGFQANLIWLGCFSKAESGYAVFFDLMYEQKAEARKAARGLRQSLKRQSLTPQSFAIRTFSRKK